MLAKGKAVQANLTTQCGTCGIEIQRTFAKKTNTFRCYTCRLEMRRARARESYSVSMGL